MKRIEVSINDTLKEGFIPTNSMNIIFSDGVSKQLTETEIYINKIMLEVLIKNASHLPIVSGLSIDNFYTNNMFSGNSITKAMSNILTYIVDGMIISKAMNQETLKNVHYDIFNVYTNIHGILIYNILDNVINIDIIDLVEIQVNEKLLNAMDIVKKEMTVDSINNAYDVLDDVMRNDIRYKNNPIANMYIAGTINARQIRQVLGPRGFVTEIDSRIFKYPIVNSFTQGLNDLYSFATESRSAAKALEQSTTAIRNSEFFGRELQLACMSVEKIVFTDCGNTDYIDWYVKKDDLYNLIGKNYLGEDGKTYSIKGDEDYLIGKTIRLRSVKDCKLKNPHHVCIACFGNLGFSVPKHANVGVLSASTLSGQSSQLILSTKHHTVSAASGVLHLDEIGKKVLIIKKNGFALKQTIKNKKVDSVYLTVSSEEAFGLQDIKGVDILKINPERVSKIEHITIDVHKGDIVDTYRTNVRHLNRYGVFTQKFLEYINKVGFTLNSRGDYVILLNEWTSVLPIMTLPEIEFSYSDFSAEIKRLTISRFIRDDGTTDDSYESLLSKLFTLVNSKLNINISVLEIIVYAFTAYDSKNGDFRLGRNSPDLQLTNITNAINSRSLGGGYAYSDIMKKVFSPDSFSTTGKNNHPFDIIIKPNEVLANE